MGCSIQLPMFVAPKDIVPGNNHVQHHMTGSAALCVLSLVLDGIGCMDQCSMNVTRVAQQYLECMGGPSFNSIVMVVAGVQDDAAFQERQTPILNGKPLRRVCFLVFRHFSRQTARCSALPALIRLSTLTLMMRLAGVTFFFFGVGGRRLSAAMLLGVCQSSGASSGPSLASSSARNITTWLTRPPHSKPLQSQAHTAPPYQCGPHSHASLRSRCAHHDERVRFITQDMCAPSPAGSGPGAPMSSSSAPLSPPLSFRPPDRTRPLNLSSGIASASCLQQTLDLRLELLLRIMVCIEHEV